MKAFENAKNDIKGDPDVLGVYLPLLNKLDLPLFEICKNANKLAKTLVTEWLRNYLLKDEPEPDKRAAEVTEYLSTHKDRLSHGRPITLATIKNDLKIKHVIDLKDDPDLRVLITELWAEIEYFVENTGTAKFFENAYGVNFRRAFQLMQQPLFFQMPMVPQPQPQPAPTPQPPPTPPSSGPGTAAA